MFIASMIHVAFYGKQSEKEKVSPGKLKVLPCFFLHSEPSLVAIDQGMGPSEQVNTFFMSSCWVCAPTAIMTKRSPSALRMTSFPDFKTADFFAFVSKDFNFYTW